MKLQNEHIVDAWKNRLHVLKMRKPSWILEVAWLNIGFILVATLTRRASIQQTIAFLALYVAFLVSFYVIALRLENPGIKTNYLYNIKIVLYQTNDQMSMALLSLGFWNAGLWFLEQSHVFTDLSRHKLQTILNFFLLTIFAVTFYYSVRFARYRIEMSRTPNPKLNLSSIGKLLGSLPALGVVFGVLLSRFGNKNIAPAFISALLLVSVCFFLLLLFTSFFTNLLIFFHRWPIIEKHGDEYIVENFPSEL